MAVATKGGKPARAGERDVSLVLGRSSVNLANTVTLGRLITVVPVVWLIATERLQAAFWLFVAAGVSDAIDGFIAKNFNSRTELGTWLDPLADKILLNGIYLAMAVVGWLPAWLAVMVIGRDVLIITGVVLIQRRDPLFRAEPLMIGKLNTFAQIVLAAVALAHAGGLVDLASMIPLLIGAAALTTIGSGAGYAAQGLRACLRERCT
ncbi:MAG: CDP-alcohol phosphatidyltransferase family protein [Geminicoccaceae bacterium]|nr:CDP-alcohol phosphatidyltransferase family protein [Geminicoccaceae bacterium]